jgi:hypothetical protein
MFDVFYIGKKPGLFAHEREVDSIQQAQQQCRTRYCWIVNYLSDYTGWDWLWEPVPWQSHQRHAWGSQHQADSGTYLVPKSGYNETNYHTDKVIKRLTSYHSWQVPGNISSSFDFSWHPDPADPPLTYYFGTQWQRTGGPVFNNGSDTIKIVESPRATALPTQENWSKIELEFDYSWHPDLLDSPFIYQFGTQHQKTGGPRYCVPGATDIKYCALPRLLKTTVDDCWKIPDSKFEDFDYTWHPDATDGPFIYQFGTQHQKTGGPRYHVTGATDIKYVDQIKIKTDRVATAVYEIDFLDGNAGQIPNTTKIVRYFDNYLDTLKRIAKHVSSEHEFIWICSSICDYTDFDFSWHPEQWQATMLHVFSSDGEKFGDTFFMHVPTFAYRSEQCKLLDWYDLNFVRGQDVPRRPIPIIQHNNDSHVDIILNTEWKGPLAVFSVNDTVDKIPTVPLWRPETKTIVPMSRGSSSVVVPRVAIPYIKTQIYDYSYIDKTQQFRQDQPLDIVFISNGEPNADANWEHLQRVSQDKPNRCVRVDGVNGRGAAYKAAAESSQTPWFFAVFAKLEADADFDWSWQPDRLQQAKHYIFNARNPVNGLEYGHQGLIAYNKKLVMSTEEIQGLDFTLSQPHGVEPIMSGVAHYNTDPWSTWRTAFREVAKLQHYAHVAPDVETDYRLGIWQSRAEGSNAAWSLRGAQDAVDYYQTVDGQYDQLLLTFEWAWLRQYFNKKYQV